MSKAPLCAVVLVALVASNLTAQRGGRGGGGGASPVGPPRFTYLGPENGGRIAAVAGVSGDTVDILLRRGHRRHLENDRRREDLRTGVR